MRVNQSTEWCTGMVVVPKANSQVRICVDLNLSVKRERHPLPAVDQILALLEGAKVFTKLDAITLAFSRYLSNPHLPYRLPSSRYGFHRLRMIPFGISSEHFQRRMSVALSGTVVRPSGRPDDMFEMPQVYGMYTNIEVI